jgi:hypothetical protein
MASTEIEQAWRSSGLRGRDVSPHLAFVQGYEAATAVKADAWDECMAAMDAAWGHEDAPWPTNPYRVTPGGNR